MERLSPALHASVRRALRQAWELDDAAKAEKLIRNLAQRLERDAPGVSKSILEGLDEILTVSRLVFRRNCGARWPAPTSSKKMMGTVRRVTRNVKRWSSSSMALRWTAAAMNEAKKTLSQAQSLQATSCLAGRACRSLRKGDQQSRSCPNCEGRLTSFTATLASQSSTEHGAIRFRRSTVIQRAFRYSGL
jgi:hypothetical protein